MKKINKKTLLLWQLRTFAVALLLEISTVFLPREYPMVQTTAMIVIITVSAVLIFFYLPLCYKNFFYKIEENAICIKSGVIYRSEKQIPLKNVLYISFVATPLERLLRLKTAVIFTAGSMTLLGSLDKQDDI